MDNWLILASFTYPHEEHLAKSKLHSEGIEVLIKDELTVQVYNFYSNAIGGVKLQVRASDFERAHQILVDSGYIHEKKSAPSRFWLQFDNYTRKIPLLDKLLVELRLLVLVALTLLCITIPIVMQSMPSTLNKLLGNYWCIDKIYYRGQVFRPYSLGVRFQIHLDNCDETMNFEEDGMAYFPGINSNKVEARWKLIDDQLIIFPDSNTTSNTGPNYYGTYSLSIENGSIKMQSDSMAILGFVYRIRHLF
ncbi:hypothetical protein GC194_02700 [bacterium]|nr:hypothetical protein [bacterium]